MTHAPIILFVYARPDHTWQTLEALSSNTLAQESDLFIYADGPKANASEEQRERIRQTREVARSRQWCRTITVIESDMNKGLAASIISGVTETVNRYGKVIVLEDDIVTGKYFLEYMNEALERYESEKQVWEITGFRFPVKSQKPESSFFSSIPSCWGWATWADRWKFLNKDALYFKTIFTKRMIWEFNIDGSSPGNWTQVEQNLAGKINTWAVFWAATIYLNKGLILTPCKSLVNNVGFDNSGENCGKAKWSVLMDSINQYPITNYPANVELDSLEFDSDKRFRKNITRNERVSRIVFFIPGLVLSFLKLLIPKKTTRNIQMSILT